MQYARTVQSTRFRSIAYTVTTAILLLTARVAGAAVDTGLKTTGDEAKLNTTNTDLPVLIGSIVRSLLGFVGVIFLVLIIYAGFLWMTSGGNEEQVSKAKKILSGGVIGMILIFASYAITQFVLNAVLTST